MRAGLFPPAPPPLPHPILPQRVFVIVDGIPILARHPDQPWPTASTGKIMTAYAVLHDPALPLTRPLAITAKDVAMENLGYLNGYSEVPLKLGQRYTVEQLLYALLLPSADDAADVLAMHDRGGWKGFLSRMNHLAARMGLRHSHFTDPAGVSPSNQSSARDLVRLTESALDDPLFARIVATRTYHLRHVGWIGNLNWMLWNVPGSIGVKTGWTSQAGHALVFAAQRSVDGEQVEVIGAILGMALHGGSFTPVFHEGRALVEYAFRDLYRVDIPAGPVGTVTFASGVRRPIILPARLSFVLPRGMAPTLTWHSVPAVPRSDRPTTVAEAVLSVHGVPLAALPLVAPPLPSWYVRLYAIGQFLAHL